MLQLALDLRGAINAGPLFAPSRVRRAPRARMQSTHRDRVVRSRIPPWADRKAIAEVFKRARELTRATGIQHSVDHIVPLNHPLVAGFHVAENLRVIPLAENVRKSNATWPDMPEVQEALLLPCAALPTLSPTLR